MPPSSKKAENAVSTPLTRKAPLEQVVRRALTDEVLTTLRKAIVAGAFAPGDHVPETRMAEQLGVNVLSVELVDDRWYHLDTCFFALTPKLVVFYPGAFDTYGQETIRSHFETIEVNEAEALRFACNSIVLAPHIVLPANCPQLSLALEKRGYTVHPVNLTEFLKAGGSAKCLTLHLPGV